MFSIKQSTSRAVVFFAHDANGDGVTGVADGSWTKRISKNGAAFAAMTVTITEMENGWYTFTLSTAHTDTVGFLAVSLSAAAAKRVNLLFDVSVRILDDLATSAALTTVQADTDDIQTRLPTALVGGRMDASVGAMAADVLTAAALAASAVDEIVNAVWDELVAEARIASSYGQKFKDLDVTVAGEVNVGQWLGSVPSTLIAGRVDANAQVVGVDAVNAAALALDAGQEIADRVLARNVAGGSDGGRSVTQALRRLRNRTRLTAGTYEVYQENDTTIDWSGAATQAAGNPITEIDPT